MENENQKLIELRAKKEAHLLVLKHIEEMGWDSQQATFIKSYIEGCVIGLEKLILIEKRV